MNTYLGSNRLKQTKNTATKTKNLAYQGLLLLVWSFEYIIHFYLSYYLYLHTETKKSKFAALNQRSVCTISIYCDKKLGFSTAWV